MLAIILLRSCNSLMFDTEKETVLLRFIVFSSNVGLNKCSNTSYSFFFFLILVILNDSPVYIINCTVQEMTSGTYLT